MSENRPPRGTAPAQGVVPSEESAPEGTATALKRIPLVTTVTKEYDYFSEFIAEFGEHIYPQGMFVPSARPRPKGARLKLDFHTRDGFQIVDAVCEVVRCDEALPGTLSGMWVSFTYISNESQELIARIYSQREVSTSGKRDKPADASSAPSKPPEPPPEGEGAG